MCTDTYVFFSIWNNNKKVIIDNCEIAARDALISVYGAYQNKNLNIRISNTNMTGTGATPTTGESAIFARWAHNIRIANVKIKHLHENFQIYDIDELLVDRLNGVNNINAGDVSQRVLIRDSILGLSSGGPVFIYGNAYIQFVNSMLVRGLDGNTAETILLNCYNENLEPVPAP